MGDLPIVQKISICIHISVSAGGANHHPRINYTCITVCWDVLGLQIRQLLPPTEKYKQQKFSQNALTETSRTFKFSYLNHHCLYRSFLHRSIRRYKVISFYLNSGRLSVNFIFHFLLHENQNRDCVLDHLKRIYWKVYYILSNSILLCQR